MDYCFPEYFADNYWRNQLTKANDGFFSKRLGKLTANQLTDFPKNKIARIAKSRINSERGEKFWENMDKAKDSVYNVFKRN